MFQDKAAVFLFPLPGIRQKFAAREAFLVNAAFLEHRHHFGFGGNRGMVHARNPARFLALHPGTPDKDILNRVVEHVAHVQQTRHVGRRNHDGVRFFGRVGAGGKQLVVEPILIPLSFNDCRIVGFRYFHGGMLRVGYAAR